MKSVKERHTTIKNYLNEKDSPQGKQYIIKCPNIQIGRGGILNMSEVIKSQMHLCVYARSQRAQ